MRNEPIYKDGISISIVGAGLAPALVDRISAITQTRATGRVAPTAFKRFFTKIKNEPILLADAFLELLRRDCRVVPPINRGNSSL